VISPSTRFVLVPKFSPVFVSTALACVLSACAATPASKPAIATPAAPASAASAASTTPASAGKPFDEVVKGATMQPGFFPLWRKDDKVWLEVPPERLEQPFLFSANISHSVGERGLYASQMGPSYLAAFRKIGPSQLQLVALNSSYLALTPSEKILAEQSFSHSLLASAPVVSAPHLSSKSVLIDASFLLADIPGYATQIEQAYRLPYALDRAGSFFERTHASPELTTLSTRMHYAMARIPAQPIVPSPLATPSPNNFPDLRSFFVGYVYSLAALPAQPWTPRRTDPRLGHFSETLFDLSTDTKASPKLRYLNRWRLEKKDPQAALSEPKQPITYWLDKNIPIAYRQAVQDGVLEWNKAFEKIGFKEAIVVKQQAPEDQWDTLDARHASIRWFTGTDVGFARGPHHADPRTGEILDADIAMADVFSRSARRLVAEENVVHTVPGSRHHCTHALESANEMHFALDLLEARGDVAPDSPQADAFVYAVIKDTITHEVGHTLGLKHNFKGSTVYSRAQLQDKKFTDQYGISGSVMDYNAFNLGLSGEPPTSVNNTTLGPYDYWAIAYAYQPFASDLEARELGRIAARSTEPLLTYADDSDAGGMGSDGIDPLVNRFDLGDDPLAYYQKRLQLSRELWQRVQTRSSQLGDDPTRARRVLLSGFRPLVRAAELVGKYIGGMHTVRDLPGAQQRPTYTPVAPTQQRLALKYLTQGLFQASSFRFDPQLLGRLAPDVEEWERAGPVSIAAAVLQVQTAALGRLLSPGTAQRLLDGADYSGSPMSLDEVYASVQSAIWSELRSHQEIDPLRRNLQREHLKRVQALLLRNNSTLPPDALSLVRLHATVLQRQLSRAAAHSNKLSVTSRAHLQDSLAQLTQALRASMLRG
jgi:hypothetical protein